MAQLTNYSKKTTRGIGDFGSLDNLVKNATKGNPYHDSLGRFTSGPSKAFGDYNPSDEDVFTELNGLRSGFNIKDEDRMDNGTSVLTRLENAEAVDALVRSKLVTDKTHDFAKAGQKALDDARNTPEVALIADTANRVNRNLLEKARWDIEVFAMQVADASQQNYSPKEDQIQLEARYRILDNINKSLNTATKILESRKFRMGPVGESYAKEALSVASALQAATNTIKYLSDNLSSGVLHDVFVEKPNKKAKTMPKEATLDDLADMGLIPHPVRVV